MSTSTIRGRGWFAVFLLASLLFGPAAAQDFPTRPIKIVVGFGPGGLGDLTTRTVADKIATSLGKPVVVENMPGAGGITAAASVVRSDPDGHTMLLVSGQNAIQPLFFKSLPYDPRKDFAMVSTLGYFDFVLVVDKDSPLKTVNDVIVAAKKNPDKFNLGTISAGSAQNLAALWFDSVADVSPAIIPFKTTGDVVAALISGQIQAGMETLPGVIGQLQSGRLRAIAVSADHRLTFLPDVPTVAESGFSKYQLRSWNGFVVRAKTPRKIVDILNKEVAKALQTKEVQERLIKFAIEPHASTPEEMQAVYDQDVVRWRGVMAENGLTPK